MVRWSRLAIMLAPLLFASAAGAQPVLPGAGPAQPQPGAGAPAAAAPSGMITKLNGQQAMQVLSGLTYNDKPVAASLQTNSDGTWTIALPFWGSQIYSGAVLDVCEKDGSGCYWVDFFVNLGNQSTIDAKWINAYNNSYYGARAYTANNGTLVIDYPVWVLPGVTQDYLLKSLGMFTSSIENAMKFKP
jgi:hypothetical protein